MSYVTITRNHRAPTQKATAKINSDQIATIHREANGTHAKIEMMMTALQLRHLADSMDAYDADPEGRNEPR